MNRIDTNPDALRVIAQELKDYENRQLDCMYAYIRDMESLQNDIEIDGYSQIIQMIKDDRSKLEDIHNFSTMQFVRFLLEKADALEQLGNLEIHLDFYSNDNDAELLDNTSASSKVMRGLDASAFENEEYQTKVVEKPLVVYRYFGSYELPSARDYAVSNYSHSPEDEVIPGWGSSAAGQWCSSIQSNNYQKVQEMLALNHEWGNDSTFVAEIVIPEGTAISVGKAAPQSDLPGGGIQIYIHEKSEEILKWITRCAQIEKFDFSKSTDREKEE